MPLSPAQLAEIAKTNKPATSEGVAAQATDSKPAVPMWQHYKSSRPAMRMITKEGIRIAFTKFTYMTQDPSVIAYLDAEIAAGLNVITKGELLTAEESDPLEALKRKHVAEYKAELLAEQIAAMKGEKKDMGSTAVSPTKIKTATTEHVAN